MPLFLLFDFATFGGADFLGAFATLEACNAAARVALTLSDWHGAPLCVARFL